MVIFSHEQTAGRGQRGKEWVSSEGLNIALSIIVNPSPLNVAQQFRLSACAAVTIYRFFEKYARNETKIKWPNDLYWKDRKAGGVLIESIVTSRAETRHALPVQPESAETGNALSVPWSWAVVGIGININQTSFPAGLQNPVSLRQITGNHYDTVEMAKEICSLFNDQFTQLVNTGFDEIFAAYISNLYKRNEKVKLKKDNRVFETTIKSVSPAGRLIVEHGIEEEFDFGSVEWVM